MSTQNNKFAEIVDVILYRYNSVDSKLWGLIKNNSRSRTIDKDIILVSRDDLRNIIINNFKSEINKFRSIEGAIVYKEANSIYFMWKLVEEMHSLSWIKINLNKNAAYTRIVTNGDLENSTKTLKFSIKTIRGTFRTFDYFNKHQLPLVNLILHSTEILEQGMHYGVVKLADLLYSLDLYLSLNNTSEVVEIVSVFMDILEDYEIDNPETLVVTDYE